MIAHSDIAARIAAIDDETRRFKAIADKELESLQELCAGIGHQFGSPCLTISVEHERSLTRRGMRHTCKVCRFAEWTGDVVPDQIEEFVVHVRAAIADDIDNGGGLSKSIKRFGGCGGLIV